jgi:hypothetical protein
MTFGLVPHLIAFAVVFAGGFGVGRIKNAAKLSAINAEIVALEAKAKSAAGVVVADFQAAIAKIKSWL